MFFSLTLKLPVRVCVTKKRVFSLTLYCYLCGWHKWGTRHCHRSEVHFKIKKIHCGVSCFKIWLLLLYTLVHGRSVLMGLCSSLWEKFTCRLKNLCKFMCDVWLLGLATQVVELCNSPYWLKLQCMVKPWDNSISSMCQAQESVQLKPKIELHDISEEKWNPVSLLVSNGWERQTAEICAFY